MYGFVGNDGVNEVDVLGLGFMDFFMPAVEAADKTQVANVKNYGLVGGCAMLTKACKAAQKEYRQCKEKIGLDPVADFDHTCDASKQCDCDIKFNCNNEKDKWKIICNLAAAACQASGG
ncbi:MAG: hypothetical protein L3J39_03880 [Verrucomicrobiales bacterium]|nr:hypothetical protein [Verrucomicrobiales bacterium]